MRLTREQVEGMAAPDMISVAEAWDLVADWLEMKARLSTLEDLLVAAKRIAAYLSYDYHGVRELQDCIRAVELTKTERGVKWVPQP